MRLDSVVVASGGRGVERGLGGGGRGGERQAALAARVVMAAAKGR